MTFKIEPTPVRKAKAWGGSPGCKRLTSVLIAICFFAMLHHATQASASQPATYSLTLAWNPSASPEVTSYHVYYGTATGDYTNNLPLGNVTTATISGLSFGITYYFAITAADVDGLESDFSNEISYRLELPGSQLQSRGMSGGQFTLTVTGTPGHTYDLEATQDLATWTVIGTGLIDASGSLDFTDPDAASFSQRFYRTRDTQP